MNCQKYSQRVRDFKYPPLEALTIDNLVEKLDIQFSREFYELAEVVNFEYFSHFDILNLHSNNDYSVLGVTLRLRKTCNLPLNALWLSEDDASALIMKCHGNREEIFWIAIEDAENFCEGKPLEYNPTIFPTFTDFFEFLLTKEEEERGITS